MMTKLLCALLGLVATASVVVDAQDTPVLDERIMELSVETAKLSSLAYENATLYETGTDANGVTTYEHPDYEFIAFYNDEPDQAIVAKTNGRCYLSFRGTTLSISDWFQNIGLGSIDIYKDNNNATGESCNARGGYADFLLSPLVQQGAADLNECASSCSDPNDCVVLTGHSQGGAVALLASILLYSLNPLLFTYGQPLAVSRNCDLIRSERIYRYVNSVYIDDDPEDEPGIAYDPVPLLPAAGQGRGHYGYYLMVGDDTTSLKFLGVDGEDSDFAPGPQLSAVPHTMGTEDAFSYLSRVTSLNDNGVFPVNIEGFSGGTPCEEDNSLLCESDDCPFPELLCVAVPTAAPTTPPASSGGGESTSSAVGGRVALATVVTILGVGLFGAL